MKQHGIASRAVIGTVFLFSFQFSALWQLGVLLRYGSSNSADLLLHAVFPISGPQFGALLLTWMGKSKRDSSRRDSGRSKRVVRKREGKSKTNKSKKRSRSSSSTASESFDDAEVQLAISIAATFGLKLVCI